MGENHKQVNSYRAEGAVGANLFVKAGTAARDVEVCDTIGERALGVSLYPVADNEAVAVAEDGTVLVTSGAAVTLHAIVATDAAGKAVPTATTRVELGQAMTAAAGADELILVRLLRGGQITP